MSRPRSLLRSMPAALAASVALLAPPGAAAETPISLHPGPFDGCPADQPDRQPGFLWRNGEVEPWVTANPLDQSNVVATWQQDRWSNGGARGTGIATTFDGGATWTTMGMPGLTRCSGGPWDRSSDPWVSFGPDGRLYAVSLVFDIFAPDSGLAAQTSTDGGRTWSPPVDVSHIADPFALDDKETITADPTRPGHAYVVWDRFTLVPCAGRKLGA